MERFCHVFFDIMNNAVSRREEYSQAKLSQNLAKIREGKNEHTLLRDQLIGGLHQQSQNQVPIAKSIREENPGNICLTKFSDCLWQSIFKMKKKIKELHIKLNKKKKEVFHERFLSMLLQSLNKLTERMVAMTTLQC